MMIRKLELIYEIQNLKMKLKKQDELLKEAIAIIQDADYSNRLVKEAKDKFLSKVKELNK